jgi:hypothetical protein
VGKKLKGQWKLGESLRDRFYRNAIVKEGCWEWKGCFQAQGYPMLGHKSLKNGKDVGHRISYMVHKGPIPSGMVIMHECDNPACTNPDHLRLGTHQDNVDDKICKGRMRRGADRANSKLDWVKVKRIRNMLPGLYKHPEIAEMFGVSRSLVSMIISNKRWIEQ